MFGTEQPRYLGVTRPASDSGGLFGFLGLGTPEPKYQGVGGSTDGGSAVFAEAEIANPQIRPDSAGVAGGLIVKASPILVPVPTSTSPRRYRVSLSAVYAGNRTQPAPLSAIPVGFDEPTIAFLAAGQTTLQLTPTWVALASLPVEPGAIRCVVTVEFD